MDNIIDTILNINIWGIAKLFVLLGLAVYVVFAFIVVRQVRLMTDVVFGILTGSLRLVSWVLFLFSAFIFLFVLLLL
ncbi:hypothetical protein COS55_02445 [Candidatus Shapirobacteria bacterium CG03_land_8_20_14_0_80_40_19]|uniref:Uncharacterized protein n=4 Tax=Candidatus Shapironibacteriota TaxID=1752721 RepID=A0A2M7BDE9_9BACT|nr:MAG: hypothetical protein COV89_00165 [Candidatus Shapirobacteria bacterium CG11_big_fil_rev_8_21_14_0_20_40_12]PIV01123.1 MAG: hypothetical protein COS55_02445 [Candidatus Shapirobacteria bacterium CG03_land_8_20_14_0_80_40_19]PJC28573.1 MAG: hypothetical protein CO053_03885 [Candidatus Shapirobacteria bacterium CG_4_9_14_0_2_um_filter_40_11]PJC76876.1 MAG: hypothetical protein CO010_01475 [Candidatus Shapirobacteria bacterium CG_4_8_14_3_um_filter_39_11]